MDHNRMRRSHLLAFARPLLLSVVVLFAPPVLAVDDDATAEATDPGRARLLFKQGRQLAALGKYHEACAMFEESLRFDGGIGTEFNLADCFEHIGRTASAHALFGRVTQAALRSGQQNRAELARARVVLLEPKLSRLLIKSQTPAADLELSRDGKPIGRVIGQPFAVDPGPHDIEVRWPNQRKWSVRLDVPATAGTVVVIVPKLEEQVQDRVQDRVQDQSEDQTGRTPAPPSVEPVAVVPPRRVAQVDAQPRSAPAVDLVAHPQIAAREGGSTLRTAAFVFGGVGVAALAAGGWMALRYSTSNEDASAICPTNINCTAAQIEEHDRLLGDARSALRWTYVGLGAGGAALIGATVSYLRSRPDESPAESNVAAAPLVTPGAFGFLLRGRW